MLKGKSAIITGSTSGIGLAIAHAMAKEGCNLILNGLGEKAMIDWLLSEFPKQYGIKAAFSPADMTKPAEIRDMVKLAENTFGGPDVLVNNAGIQQTGSVDTYPEDVWDKIIAINL